MTDPVEARKLLVSAVWHGTRRTSVDDRLLADAARFARHNRVEGLFAQIYSDRLAGELARSTAATVAFRRNLEEASDRLLAAGVQPIAIKLGLDEGEDAYSNFDLVVGDDGWDAALLALDDWTERRSSHPLEPGKVLLHPPSGPAAHLHRSVSWFEIPVVSNEHLRVRATRRDGASWWIPSPSDDLRIRIAHAAFQNLALDLGDFVGIRPLLDPRIIISARTEAEAEGWRRGFDSVLALSTEAIERLNAGEPLGTPVAMPPATSFRVGIEHGVHLWRSRRRGTAMREAGLRVPLIVAKARRNLVEADVPQVPVVGLSGPDGAGKTTTARAVARRLEDEGWRPLHTYLYGCILCRRVPTAASRSPVEKGAWEERPHSVGRGVLRAHALLDACECTVRLAAARLRARRRVGATSGVPIVLTDRTPLDGLAKHDPAAESVVGRWYLGLARRFGLIIWLDASAEELEARDCEHPAHELEGLRRRFAFWAERLPNVERFDVGGRSAEAIASDAHELLAERRRAV